MASTHDIHHGLVEHAGRSVDQKQDALPTHFETCQIKAIAIPRTRTNGLTTGNRLLRRRLQPFRAFFQCREVRFQLLQSLPARQGFVGCRLRLRLFARQRVCRLRGGTLRLNRFVLRQLHDIAEHHEIAPSFQHLLFYQQRLRAQVIGLFLYIELAL